MCYITKTLANKTLLDQRDQNLFYFSLHRDIFDDTILFVVSQTVQTILNDGFF